VVLASDNLTYLPTPQLTTREQPFHTKHLPASYISRPYKAGGDYVGKKDPVNITCLYIMNNDIEDLLRFQATVHLYRETTTANALADMGGSDNFIARLFLGRLQEAGVTIEMRKEGLMEVCTAGKRSLSETLRRDRVRVAFGIGSTYKSELWFVVYDLEDYNLIFGKPWFCQHNLQHTIDYVKNMMWIEDERGHHVLEGLPPMALERGKEVQRLGLQMIRWKEVQRELYHG
jgi:hypothetical protein